MNRKWQEGEKFLLGKTNVVMAVHSIRNGIVRLTFEFPNGAMVSAQSDVAKRGSPITACMPSREGLRQILLFGGKNGGEILIHSDLCSVKIRIINVQKESVGLKFEGEDLDG